MAIAKLITSENSLLFIPLIGPWQIYENLCSRLLNGFLKMQIKVIVEDFDGMNPFYNLTRNGLDPNYQTGTRFMLHTV